jgi:cell division protein FtsA
MNALSRLPVPVEGQPERRRRGARSGAFGVLDIGTTKTVCLIARIEGDGAPRVLGFGWQRGRGVKGGSIIDLEEAERAIRAAVGQAEEMSDTQLSGAIVNLSCGQPDSRLLHVQWPIGGRAVTDADLRAILSEGRRRGHEDGRETVHGAPVSFTVDATPGVEDPRGMVCDTLGARVHLVDASQAALRNLGHLPGALRPRGGGAGLRPLRRRARDPGRGREAHRRDGRRHGRRHHLDRGLRGRAS